MDQLEHELESIVDRFGPNEALAAVCHAKAEHVRCNWQDEPLAKVWERNAMAFDRAAGQVTA